MTPAKIRKGMKRRQARKNRIEGAQDILKELKNAESCEHECKNEEFEADFQDYDSAG